ncbi:MAG: DUF711 family protein, partial [Ruminococcaceae bacterium]|nr:DUF711 family protein [Oscillospiraceae bacterium]
MFVSVDEIAQTIRMIQKEHLDIRTVTMGINLLDCADSDINRKCDKIYDKICQSAGRLVPVCQDIERKYGIPIVNKRISVTPIGHIANTDVDGCVKIAKTLEKAANATGVNF